MPSEANYIIKNLGKFRQNWNFEKKAKWEVKPTPGARHPFTNLIEGARNEHELMNKVVVLDTLLT
jgi:hypothetical protein